MPDTIKERDFAHCDCPMGKYSLHCTEEQKNQILKNQRITSVISGIAESEGIKIYELITKYETLKEQEKQFTENQKIVDKLKKYHSILLSNKIIEDRDPLGTPRTKRNTTIIKHIEEILGDKS